MVSNFLLQALQGEPLTVYGDGSQTRSLCYVDDEVRGLIALFDSDLTGPVNIGNPDEYTVLELAQTVVDLLGSSSPIVHLPLPTDDPTRRRPDITVARAELGWEPTTGLDDGLARTADGGGRRDRTGADGRGAGGPARGVHHRRRAGAVTMAGCERPDPGPSNRGDRSHAQRARPDERAAPVRRPTRARRVTGTGSPCCR